MAQLLDPTAIETGIKDKLKTGAIWNSVAQFGQQGINFILTLILARLLTPEDFGLLGMATVISGFIAYFSEFGLIASIIKKAEVDDRDCHTAFWACVVFSIGTYLVIYMMSPLIAVFYHCQELVPITRAVSVVFLLSMYTNVPYALEVKKLRYNKITLIRLVSLLVSGLPAVILAFCGFGVWALVWQQIIMHVVQVFGYLLVFRWIPRAEFSFSRFKELAAFGFHFTMNNMFKFASENIDYLLVGKLLGPTALGVYTMAFRLSRYPLEKLWGVFGKMLLPAFALMQDDRDRMKRNVLRVSSGGAFLLMPVLVIILVSTQSYVQLAVGDQWLSTVPLIKMFVAYLALMSVSFSDEAALMVAGKIRAVNTFRFVCTLFILGLGYWGIGRFNLFGMAAMYSLVVAVYQSVIKLLLIKRMNWTVSDYLGGMRKPLVYCAVILVIGYICMRLVENSNGGLTWVTLGVGCSALGVYGILSGKTTKKIICDLLPWGYS